MGYARFPLTTDMQVLSDLSCALLELLFGVLFQQISEVNCRTIQGFEMIWGTIRASDPNQNDLDFWLPNVAARAKR